MQHVTAEKCVLSLAHSISVPVLMRDTPFSARTISKC